MPYKDVKKQRQYQREYNKKRRGGINKNIATAQTRIETAEDLRLLLQNVVDVISNSKDELELEAWARILLKAVEVGLKLVEVTDLEKRLTALEVHLGESRSAPQNQNRYAPTIRMPERERER